MKQNGSDYDWDMDPFGDQLASKDGMLVTNNGGQVELVNREFCRMWQVTAKAVKKWTVAKLIDCMASKMRESETVRAETTTILGRTNGIYRNEAFLDDGRVIDVHSFPMIGAENKISGRIWYMRDVTEQKKS